MQRCRTAQRTRRLSWLGRSANVVLLFCLLASIAAASITGAKAWGASHPLAEPPSDSVLAALRDLRVRLITDQSTPVFRLYYAGPITRPFGPLCYRFAGYSETCTRLNEPWLTPATPIELYAPGGVPLDLLAGYQLLVRFPHWTNETFQPQQHPLPKQETRSLR